MNIQNLKGPWTYKRIADGVKIRSRCQWYQEIEKSTKFFLNFGRKKRSVKALVRKQEVNEKEICDQAKLNDETKIFFEETYNCHKGKSSQIVLKFWAL